MRSCGGWVIEWEYEIKARMKEVVNRSQQMKVRVDDGKYPLPGGQRFGIGLRSALWHVRNVLYDFTGRSNNRMASMSHTRSEFV